MKLSKKGIYTKVMNITDNTKTVLVFNAESKNDNDFKSMKRVQSFEGFSSHNTTQSVETRIELEKFFEMNFHDMENQYNTKKIHKYFNHLVFTLYNIYGQQINESVMLKFDFENSIVWINDRKYKVENDSEYTYKFLKTKIKANCGIKGFYEHILESMHVDSPLHSSTHSTLLKASENTKENNKEVA